MHLQDGTLRALLDGELQGRARARAQRHLATCARCEGRLSALRIDVEQVAERLDALAPGALESPGMEQALRRLHSQASMDDDPQRSDRMTGKTGINRNWQRALSGLAVVAVLAVLFAFEPVRAAARELLAIFRIQEIVVLPITSGQVENLENLQYQLGSDFFPGSYDIVDEPEDAAHVDSLAAASQQAGYALRAPGALAPADDIVVRGQMALRFVPDVELMREVFRAAGLSPDLVPPDVDGQPFNLTIPPSVVQLWNSQDEALVLMQMPSPIVEFPEGVDEPALAAAMLQLLGFSEEEALRLSASINWTSTLVLPVPTDLVTVEEVTVDGTTGFLMMGEAPQSETQQTYMALLWQSGGQVYLLSGGPDGQRLVEVANSLQ